MQKSPPVNCLSLKQNLFEIQNINENPFNTQSVEKEGEYIFTNDRFSECNYNYYDAKQLEYQFKQIDKKY
jgi:hypothetical protein